MSIIYVSRTLVANHLLCEGFLSFNPLAFTHVPPDVTTSKLCEDSIFGNSGWHCVFKIYGFILVKKLVTLGYVAGILSHGNFSLFSENFKLVSQQK
jgi:hypothetical protein